MTDTRAQAGDRYETLAGLLNAYRTPVALILVGILVSLVLFFVTLYGQSREKERTFQQHANARLTELDAGFAALMVELNQVTSAARSGLDNEDILNVFRDAQIAVIRDLGIARNGELVSAYETDAADMVARALAPRLQGGHALDQTIVLPLANDRRGNLSFAAIQPIEPGSRDYTFVVSDLNALISRTATPGDPLWIVARIGDRAPALIVSESESRRPDIQDAQRSISLLQESAPFIVRWEAQPPFDPISAVLIPQRSFLITVGPLPWLVLIFSLFATAAIGTLSLKDARKAAEVRVEVERKTRALKLSHDIIAAKNEELGRFAAHASHDLQAPLRAMKGISSLLVEREINLDARSQEMLERINRGAERAQRLVQDLLSYTKADRAEAKIEIVDTDALVQEVTEFLAGPIEETGAHVTWQLDVEIKADPFLLTRALQNLVANGIKYRRDTAPRVHVSARRDASGVTICVADNGIGIREEYFHKIFEVFQRLHGADRYDGSGIGLAMCKRVADLHHGRIWVESVPDAGSRFYLFLPDPDRIKRDEEAAAAVASLRRKRPGTQRKA